jgi:hypothetical protein
MPAVLGINASRPARALPGWVTEPEFVAAGLAAPAMPGHAAGATEYGIAGLRFYWIVYLWIGAVPAVILLGLLVAPPAPRET